MTDETGLDNLRTLARIAEAATNFFAVSRHEQFEILRNIYVAATPMILEAGKHGCVVDPYFVDWVRYFTPIEMDAWQAIRYHGLPLYPQYPALNYFIDFADPNKKIGLELDGKAWHDRDRDRVRDTRLFNEAGWRIFRVSGSVAEANLPSPSELEEMGYEGNALEGGTREWAVCSVDGVVAAIGRLYYRRGGRIDVDSALHALDVHRLAKFPIDVEV